MPVELLEDGRKRIGAPLSDDDVRSLVIGDVVLVNGRVYAARDAAHRRMAQLGERGEPMPFDPQGQIVYYLGPTPARPGRAIGAAGPTTASRMDPYTPRLLGLGLKGIIGKGGVGSSVRQRLVEHVAVCMAALGGGGAVAALRVRAQSIVAFEDLGPEAIRLVELDDLPAWVVNDCRGDDLYANVARGRPGRRATGRDGSA